MSTANPVAAEPALELELGLSLGAIEQEALAAEAEAFAATLRDPEAAARYRRLGDGAREGLVPAALMPALETLLEILLQTQRVRREHGPEAGQALEQLFFKTPRGRGLRTAVSETNHALQALEGQTIERLAFTATSRGYQLDVETDRCRVSLTVDRQAVSVKNLKIGG